MVDPRPCDLSVILPAYNAAEFIGPAIRSVLEQIPPQRAVEIVVSLNVFHAPQSGHCPAHLTLWAPQAEQR